MICRMWRGWTRDSDADAYDEYLQHELFSRLGTALAGHGYCGYHVLRLKRGVEVEFVTLVWFDSIEVVKSFAGHDYQTPVLSEKARNLLMRFADRAEHYDVSGSHWAVQR